VNRTELERLKDMIVPLLTPYGVRRVAVFGSVARGEDLPGSDLDVLVSLPPPGERPTIGLKWFALVDELSAVLERPVDLVTEEALSPYIRPYVEEEMVVIYEQE